MKKLLVVVLIIVIGALGAKKLLSEKEKIANQSTALSLNYTIKTVHTHDANVSQKRSFLAKLESNKEIKIMTKLSGTIKALHVSESQAVKKGELLVEIDDTALQSKLKTLQETLKVQKNDIAYATSVYERSTKLYEAKAISKEKYDAAHLQLLNKQAQRDATKESIIALKSDLEYLQVRAPFDGIVSAIYLHVGDMASFSKPIIALNGYAQKMQFSFASSSNAIKINDMVLLENTPIGLVSKIYPNAKNNLSVAEVKMNESLPMRTNSYLSIEVITRTLQGCALPLNALLHVKDATYVLAYKDNAFEKREVKIEIEDDTQAVISPCISEKVALGSESKLSILPFYKHITLVGDSDEK